MTVKIPNNKNYTPSCHVNDIVSLNSQQNLQLNIVKLILSLAADKNEELSFHKTAVRQYGQFYLDFHRFWSFSEPRWQPS